MTIKLTTRRTSRSNSVTSGLINNGFPAFPMADPTLIGDITRNGLIQANDTTSIQRVIGLVNVPNVPALPTGLPPAPSGGPDPTIFIPD